MILSKREPWSSDIFSPSTLVYSLVDPATGKRGARYLVMQKAAAGESKPPGRRRSEAPVDKLKHVLRMARCSQLNPLKPRRPRIPASLASAPDRLVLQELPKLPLQVISPCRVAELLLQ